MQAIIRFKNKLAKERVRGLALDIDETLSWTVGYWVKEMQKKFGNPENLTTREIVEKYRYTQNVPYWQTEEAYQWMEERRESNEIQEKLPLIENANDIVHKIHTLIPIAAYITARPESTLSGTKAWLKKHNFPKTTIITRPRSVVHEDSSEWKAGVLCDLYPEVIGIIDDNPSLVDALPESYKGIVYLYDHVEYHKKHITVVSCKTWLDVYKNVKNSLRGSFPVKAPSVICL